MKLSEKIYYCRRKLGISQEELAERIGVTRQAVSKWETDTAVPELDKLSALSKAFGVTADWLLSEDDPPENSQTDEEPSQQAPHSNEDTSSANYSKTQTTKSYPEWLDTAPPLIVKILKRFGWLFGVYVTVVGVLFMSFGGFVHLVSSMIFTKAEHIEELATDIFITDLPGYAPTVDSIINGSASTSVSIIHPISIVANIALIIGAVITICGIILTILLRKYAKK